MKPQIVFIGTSASVPTHTRSSPAILICSFKTCILLDAGEATQINLGRVGIDLLKINIIGITHMHGDHYYGLLPLIDTITMKLASQNIQKQHTITLLGPRELCPLFQQFPTYSSRIGVGPTFDERNIVKIECIDAEVLSSNKGSIRTLNDEITVASVSMSHGDTESYGYIAKVKTNEKANKFITVFYSGDGICNSKCIDILRMLNPCIVIHEATYIDYESDKTKAKQTFHATVGDAAFLAQSIAARILIITHMSLRYKAEWIRDYLSRARRIFSGDVFIADDLSILPLDRVDC